MSLSSAFLLTLGLILSVTVRTDPAGAVEPDTEAWARVLTGFHYDGGLDYIKLAEDREDLDLYLASLAEVSVDGWSQARRIAFWCNAYNAVVVRHVLERLPGLESVKDVPGFFDELTFRVAAQDRTLDEMETAARDFGDPRVHFAVVCASISCPDLQPEPFREDVLDDQLEAATREFLADSSKGLFWVSEDNALYLSSIFKWYAGDFTGGSTVVAFFARGQMVEWLLPHLSPELASSVRQADPGVKYMDYNWGLNQRSEP